MTIIAATTSATRLLGRRPYRRTGTIRNTSTNAALRVVQAGQSALTALAPSIAPGGFMTLTDFYTGEVWGMWDNPITGSPDGGAEVVETVTADRKQASHRLTATDRATQWGLMVQARNASGLWPHDPVPDTNDAADIRIHSGVLDLARGVQSREESSVSLAVVMETTSTEMTVGFIFGGLVLEGGETSFKFGGDAELRTGVRDGKLSHILTRGVGTFPREAVPTPAFLNGDPGQGEITILPDVGDVLIYLRNGGGDEDTLTGRVFYTVGDDG